jgi:CBS domain-containing protein
MYFLCFLCLFAANSFSLALFPSVEQNKSMTESESSAISRKRCREIMTKTVRTATSEMSVREVAAIMRDGDMGAVPVVDSRKLIGIVTDRDIVVRLVAEGHDANTAVSEAMTRELFTVGPDDFVFEAIRLMGDKQVRRVPVINDNGELAGIIAMADVALETEDEREIAETLEEISSGASFWGKN